MFGVKIFNPFPSATSYSSHSKGGIAGQSSDFFFISWVFTFWPRTHYNHICQEINLSDYISTLYFSFIMITHSIYDNKFQENHSIILKLYHKHFLFSLLTFFLWILFVQKRMLWFKRKVISFFSITTIFVKTMISVIY